MSSEILVDVEISNPPACSTVNPTVPSMDESKVNSIAENAAKATDNNLVNGNAVASISSGKQGNIELNLQVRE